MTGREINPELLSRDQIRQLLAELNGVNEPEQLDQCPLPHLVAVTMSDLFQFRRVDMNGNLFRVEGKGHADLLEPGADFSQRMDEAREALLDDLADLFAGRLASWNGPMDLKTMGQSKKLLAWNALALVDLHEFDDPFIPEIVAGLRSVAAGGEWTARFRPLYRDGYEKDLSQPADSLLPPAEVDPGFAPPLLYLDEAARARLEPHEHLIARFNRRGYPALHSSPLDVYTMLMVAATDVSATSEPPTDRRALSILMTGTLLALIENRGWDRATDHLVALNQNVQEALVAEMLQDLDQPPPFMLNGEPPDLSHNL